VAPVVPSQRWTVPSQAAEAMRFAIGTNGDVVNEAGVPAQAAGALQAGGVPEQHGLIHRCGRDPFPVRAVASVPDRLRAAEQGGHEFAAVRVPQAQRAVVGGCQEAFAVRAEVEHSAAPR
jgi:hypothetical protein